MLKSLRVQNFAIISDITLNFDTGLTVFSGETGAGKSIVIEALGFVLGARADNTMIKDGADKMTVSVVFSSDILPEEMRQQFQFSGDTFTLKRELDRKGRNKATADGRAVTVSTLAQIGSYLVDFHGQHEHQSLFHSSVHLSLLDKFAKLETLTAQVQTAFSRVQQVQTKLDSLHLSAQEKQRLLDMSQYQLDEIERINPSANEDAELEQTLPKLKHGGKLAELSNEAYQELYGAEDSATTRLARAAKALTNMASLDDNLNQLSTDLNNALVTLEDISSTLSDYKQGLNVDENTLDKLLERHEKIKRLKLKYGPELSDVLKTAEDLRLRINNLKHSEEHEQDLLNELSAERKKLLTLSQKLHDKRFENAQKLTTLITEQIRPLGFNQIRFSVNVEIDEENLTATGCDKVEFLFSPNPGQSLRPLKNIASGGEISRVMLGLKTVLAPTVPVMVFDEIDAGIGGETGLLIGQKLRACAQGRQVLCVTHLAQVAAQANQNFHVQKTANKNSTNVTITPLSGENLTAEIARMLGGNSNKHSAAYLHAKELLSQVKK